MDELLWLLCLSELVHLRKALQTGGSKSGSEDTQNVVTEWSVTEWGFGECRWTLREMEKTFVHEQECCTSSHLLIWPVIYHYWARKQMLTELEWCAGGQRRKRGRNIKALALTLVCKDYDVFFYRTDDVVQRLLSLEMASHVSPSHFWIVFKKSTVAGIPKAKTQETADA